MSPSSRGRGLKWFKDLDCKHAILSPSSRGRGLKYCTGLMQFWFCSVALFTRAWIEILYGLIFIISFRPVALFTRAWIEINCAFLLNGRYVCRPLHEGVDWNPNRSNQFSGSPCRPLHEGVDWNYIRHCINICNGWSPSSRGRGLKSRGTFMQCGKAWSPSSRGRGLKFLYGLIFIISFRSPSSRGRGLKSDGSVDMVLCDMSPSSRGRGLKFK